MQTGDGEYLTVVLQKNIWYYDGMNMNQQYDTCEKEANVIPEHISVYKDMGDCYSGLDDTGETSTGTVSRFGHCSLRCRQAGESPEEEVKRLRKHDL